MNAIKMSAPWVFYHHVNQYNNRPPMGGTVWEESSLTEGVEDKKELAGDAKPVSLRCDVDVVAQGGQDIIHRWEWRACLGSWHLKLCFFFTDSSQKYRCFSIVFFFLFFFFMHMCEKAGKARVYSTPLPLHENDAVACERFGITRIFLWKSFVWKDGECPSLHTKTQKREHFAKNNKGDARTSKQVLIIDWEVAITS